MQSKLHHTDTLYGNVIVYILHISPAKLFHIKLNQLTYTFKMLRAARGSGITATLRQVISHAGHNVPMLRSPYISHAGNKGTITNIGLYAARTLPRFYVDSRRMEGLTTSDKQNYILVRCYSNQSPSRAATSVRKHLVR